MSILVVNGKLTCLGSGQHLKHRFGSGVEIHVKLLTSSFSAVEDMIRSLLDIAESEASHVDEPIDDGMISVLVYTNNDAN